MTPKVAAVTGGSAGIGKAICEDLLAQGYEVVSLARRKAEIDHPKLHSLEVDLSDRAATGEAVRELVELVTKLHPNPEPVATTLKRAGITQFADQRVDRLSGGQTQRVRFALAICGKSELIVLDEPTAAMDVETRRLFWNSMKVEVAAGRTLLFATHYLEEADQAADRILVINRGRLLADGTPAEIKARAGARRLSFRLGHVDEPFLLGLPGLVNLEVRHDVVQIQSSDSDATLYAVLDAGYRPKEIEVTSLGLEQAFLAITAEDDAANGHSTGETN